MHENSKHADDALRRCEGQLLLAERSGDVQEQARAEGNIAHQLWQLGRYRESLRRARSSLDRFRKIGDRWGETKIQGNLASWFFQFGRYEEARTYYERHLELSREIGYRKGELIAAGNLGIIAKSQGRFADAIRRLEYDIALCRDLGHPKGEAIGKGHLAVILTRLGDFGEARRLWREAGTEFAKRKDHRRVAYANLHVGLMHEYSGQPGPAEEAYLAAIQSFRKPGFTGALPDGLAFLGRLLLHENRPDEARILFRKAIKEGLSLTVPSGTTVAACWLAVLPREDVRFATDLYERNGKYLEHAERVEALFALYRATRNRSWLEDAYHRLVELRDHAPEAYRNSMITRVPLHREIVRAHSDDGAPETPW